VWNERLGRIKIAFKILIFKERDILGYPEEADKLFKEEANVVRSYQNVVIPFAVGKEVIRRRLRQEHLNRWKTCKGCRQSKTLMSELLISKTKELQTISRQKLQMTVGPLTGHKTLRARKFSLGLT
jgi:hypothetical protein